MFLTGGSRFNSYCRNSHHQYKRPMPRQSRQKRRRERRSYIETSHEPLGDLRPWYFRYGYHLGVWSGAALGVIWFAIFQELIGLVIGVVSGQVVGITLSRLGR